MRIGTFSSSFYEDANVICHQRDCKRQHLKGLLPVGMVWITNQMDSDGTLRSWKLCKCGVQPRQICSWWFWRTDHMGTLLETRNKCQVNSAALAANDRFGKKLEVSVWSEIRSQEFNVTSWRLRTLTLNNYEGNISCQHGLIRKGRSNNLSVGSESTIIDINSYSAWAL